MKTTTAAWLLPIVLLMAACAQSPTVQTDEQAERPDPFAAIEADPALPNVLLVGDSISIGYTVPVRERLAGIANVYRIPMNGGPTSRGVEKIDEWLGDTRWDVIHFNWGLHDLKYMENGAHQVPLPLYKRNMTQLVRRMTETGAILIWASTTPVPNERVRPPRVPQDVARFNAAAAPIMERYGVRINDLYAFALPQLESIQEPDNVHFYTEGSEALGARVAEVIEAVLESRYNTP